MPELKRQPKGDGMTSPLGNANAPSPHRQAFIRVTCFVDWNSQLLLTGLDYEKKPVDAARAAFRQVTRRIAQCLVKVDACANFQVHLRLYHGWRKGYEPTTNLKAIRLVIAETDFSTASAMTELIFPFIGGTQALPSSSLQTS